MKENPTHIVRFYGVTCYAIITDDSFELIGKNKVTHFLVSNYSVLIYKIKNVISFICSILNVDYEVGYKLTVLTERGKNEK
jgi:hypothetical protein